jgi:hypothetical protein
MFKNRWLAGITAAGLLVASGVDGAHRSYGPEMSKTITVHVK